MEKITGPALCGFADMFEEGTQSVDVVGAVPVKVQPYPKAKQSSAIATHSSALKSARAVLAKAHGQVKNAARKTLARKASPTSRVTTPTVARARAPVSAARVAVRGDGDGGDEYVVVGAAPSVAVTPKVKAARDKLAKANAAAKAARAAADTKTKVAHASVTKLASQVKNHEKIARKLSGKTRGASATAARASVLQTGATSRARAGAARAATLQTGATSRARTAAAAVARVAPGALSRGRAAVHGEYVGDDGNVLWPGEPGYDPTTENGENGPVGSNPWDGGAFSKSGIKGGGGPGDRQGDVGLPSDGVIVDPNTGLPTPTDPLTGTPVTPQQLDLDTLVAAATEAPQPPDAVFKDYNDYAAIKYDGQKGTPDGYIVSYGLATRKTDVGCEPDSADIEGNAHFGYVWGRYDKKDPPNGGIGWGSNLTPGVWNHVHGRHHLRPAGTEWFNTVPAEEAYQSYLKQVDLGAPGTHTSGYITSGAYGGKYGTAEEFMPTYGPLVGNPAMPDFRNMRVDLNGVAFWLANEAPDWLTAPLKAQAALSKAAAAKAAADADAAAKAAAIKVAADAAAALAAQQAQNALDEANAASQARQAESQAYAAESQAYGQQQAADAQMYQTDAQSYQQDTAQQQWEYQQAQQQGMQDQQLYQQQMQQQMEADRQYQQQMQQQMQMEQQMQQQQMQMEQQRMQMEAQLQQQRMQQQMAYEQQMAAQQPQTSPQQYQQPPQQAEQPLYEQEYQQQEEQQPLEDDTVVAPDWNSEQEAAAINEGDLFASEDVLGADAAALARVLGEPTIAGEDAVIGGDGEAIGLDQWGNLTE